jgi:hypothetical protein
MTLKFGTRIGSFQIGEPLGKGGMGEVYRAATPSAMTAAPSILRLTVRETGARGCSCLQNEVPKIAPW